MGLANAVERAEVADSLAALRRSTAQWLSRERDRARLETGIPRLDAVLAGGWPQGRLSEVVGVASSGLSGIAAATTAAATERGEVVAWIDAADALDPVAVREAGVDLERLLWVRPQSIGEAVRAAELILDTGGFSLVLLDLAAEGRVLEAHRQVVQAQARDDGNRVPAPAQGRRSRGKGALPLRLVRAVERAAAVLLVLACRSWAGTLAGTTVVLEGEGALWGGESRRGPRWLAGFSSTARLERGSGENRQRRASLRFANNPENEPLHVEARLQEVAEPVWRPGTGFEAGGARVVLIPEARRQAPRTVGGRQAGRAG